MKTYFHYPKLRLYSLWLLLALGMTACIDDLNTKPIDKNITTADDAYKDPAAYKQVLAKIYAVFALSGQIGPDGNPDLATNDEGSSNYLRQLWNMQELTTDEVICAWNNAGLPDLHNQSWSAANDYITITYDRIFYQISIANEYLRATTDSKLDSRGVTGDLRTQIGYYRAEARLIRDLAYYQALDLYGNVPFVEEKDGVGTFNPQQISRKDLFTWLEKDLIEVIPLLKDPHTNEYGRADQALAWTILAKLYLNAEVYTGTPRYTDAITYCNKIIPHYQPDDNYQHLFMADNHTAKGIIFPIAFDGQHTQTYGGTTFLIFAAIGGDSIVPQDYGVNSGWAGNRTTAEFMAKFDSGDRRAQFFTKGQTSIEVNQQSDFKQGVIVTKFSNMKSTGGTGSNLSFVDTDFPMYRIADIYLMYAEAILRGGTGGDLNTALGYINDLRYRAYGDNSGQISASDLTLDFILEERARELYWEGHRRTDLIRFKRFSETNYTWPWKGGVIGGRSTNSNYNLFPIPSSDLGANPNLKQNPGY